MKKLRCFEEQIPVTDVETNSKGHELKSFDEMEGEDTMEKRLRVFRARSYVAFDLEFLKVARSLLIEWTWHERRALVRSRSALARSNSDYRASRSLSSTCKQVYF